MGRACWRSWWKGKGVSYVKSLVVKTRGSGLSSGSGAWAA